MNTCPICHATIPPGRQYCSQEHYRAAMREHYRPKPNYAEIERVYLFVRKYITREGIPPTLREICDGVGVSSTSQANAHVDRLVAAGRLRRGPARAARAIALVEDEAVVLREEITKLRAQLKENAHVD